MSTGLGEEGEPTIVQTHPYIEDGSVSELEQVVNGNVNLLDVQGEMGQESQQSGPD